MFKINQDLAQSILNYLASRPYSEVYKHIDELQRLEPLEETKEETKPPQK